MKRITRFDWLGKFSRRARLVPALLAFALLTPPNDAHSAPLITIVVNSLADTAANDGVCALREAIIAANTNTASGAMAGECPAGAAGADTIGFSVTGTITLVGSALPAINGEVTIYGPPRGLTVSGNNLYRVLHVNSGKTLHLFNLTIANGSASDGGGIYNNGTVTLTNSTLSGNSATVHGGIFNFLGSATLKNTIVANSPSGGNCSGGVTDGGGNLS